MMEVLMSREAMKAIANTVTARANENSKML